MSVRVGLPITCPTKGVIMYVRTYVSKVYVCRSYECFRKRYVNGYVRSYVCTYVRTYVFVLWFGCVLRELIIVSPLTFQKNEQRPYAHGVNLPKQRTNQILICKYTYVRTYASARTDVRMSTYVRIHTCVRTYVRTCTSRRMCIRTHVRRCYEHACIYVHRCTYVIYMVILASIGTRMRAHMRIRTCMYTCMRSSYSQDFASRLS